MPFSDDVVDREDAPRLTDPLTHWPAFAERVRQRLEAGRAVYGDKSFARPPDELVMEQERSPWRNWAWCFGADGEAFRSAGSDQRS